MTTPSANLTPATFAVSSTPASTLVGLLDGLLLSVTGWSVVNAAIVVGTNTWNVYKSSGASNSFGTDFYIALGYVTATPTSIFVTVFEQWNSSTKLATNFPPNTAQTPTASYANPNAAAALPSTGTTMGYLASYTAFTTTQPVTYMAGCSADRLWFGTLNNLVNEGLYVGLYDAVNSTTIDPFPICCVRLGANAQSYGVNIGSGAAFLPGAATREPVTTTNSSANFACGCAGVSQNAWTLSNASLDSYSARYYPARAVLLGRAGQAFRGLLKDIYIGPVQGQNGDSLTWTLGGVSHTAYRIGGSSLGVYGDAV